MRTGSSLWKSQGSKQELGLLSPCPWLGLCLLAIISGSDSTRTAQEVLLHHSVQDEQDPLASKFFARRAYSMYEKTVDDDYYTLQSDMENFVELLDGGSCISFSYHDLIPKFYGPGESEIL